MSKLEEGIAERLDALRHEVFQFGENTSTAERMYEMTDKDLGDKSNKQMFGDKGDVQEFGHGFKQSGGDKPPPISKFHQGGIEEGGTPGPADAAHNAQGLRGDEGVIIDQNRILFGDTMVLGPDGKPHYMHAPMYHYHLDSHGKPILDGPPVEFPEQGIGKDTDSRLIPTGGTGPGGMPNGTHLLFGKEWSLGGSQDFPNDTKVYDTSGAGPFPKVATIPGLRM